MPCDFLDSLFTAPGYEDSVAMGGETARECANNFFLVIYDQDSGTILTHNTILSRSPTGSSTKTLKPPPARCSAQMRPP